MKLIFSIKHVDSSVRDVLLPTILKDIESLDDVSIVTNAVREGVSTRDSLTSIILAVIGGAGTIVQIADIAYKYVKTKRITVTFENSDGRKITIESDDEHSDLKKQIEDFVSSSKKDGDDSK